MPRIWIPINFDNPSVARDLLEREVEQMDAAGTRITKITYPKYFARRLLIVEQDGRAKYGKHEAVGHHGGPYEIVIEYE